MRTPGLVVHGERVEIAIWVSFLSQVVERPSWVVSLDMSLKISQAASWKQAGPARLKINDSYGIINMMMQTPRCLAVAM